MRIFNRIRHKLLKELKIKSYFMYALGEIFLIIIGILTALQINNWNEGKKDLKNEQIVLLNLQEYFSTNQDQIETSLVNLNKNKDNLMLRILHTGPNVKQPNEFMFNSLSHINIETLVLAYDGTNRILSQNQLSLISNEELRKAISAFTLASTRYGNLEQRVSELTLDLRQIHQKYVSILSQEIKSGRKYAIESNQEQFPSDYVGWFRDRDHQNKAVESKWMLENSIIALNDLESQNLDILELLLFQIKELREDS